MTEVMSRSSRSTGNLLSNKDATRQKDGKKTATTRQRVLGKSEEKRENIPARCIHAA